MNCSNIKEYNITVNLINNIIYQAFDLSLQEVQYIDTYVKERMF